MFELYSRYLTIDIIMAEAGSDATDLDWCKDGLEAICEGIGDLIESFSEKGDCSIPVCDQGNNYSFPIVLNLFFV